VSKVGGIYSKTLARKLRPLEPYLFAQPKGLLYNRGSLPEVNALITKSRLKFSVREIVSFALTIAAVALLLTQAHTLSGIGGFVWLELARRNGSLK